MGMPRLAKIIDHDVQCSQDGIQIDLKLAPFLTNWFDLLTVRPGYRSFQVLSISHRMFNMLPVITITVDDNRIRLSVEFGDFGIAEL
jgi:hypothetical protein